MNPGTRIVCVREVQKTLRESVKKLVEDKIKDLGVEKDFRVLHDGIETPGGGIVIFQGMQDYNAESIKSLHDMDVAWVEEAQTLSVRSLQVSGVSQTDDKERQIGDMVQLEPQAYNRPCGSVFQVGNTATQC